jgi:hypothetical protein
MKYVLEWTETVEYRTEIEVEQPIRSVEAAVEMVDRLDRAEFEKAFIGVPDRVVTFTPKNFLLRPDVSCPACGDPLGAYGISRYDNKTRLCTRCEVFEAMADLEGMALMGPGLAEPYDEHDDDAEVPR